MHSKILRTNLILSAIILLMVSCDKGTDPTQRSVPLLTTTEVTSISSSSATTGGNITADGGASVTSRGVCWSTNAAPTINDNITTNGSGAGNFTASITGLSDNTTYSVRAYATNSVGTGYGNNVIFTALSAANPLAYFEQTPPGRVLQPFALDIIGSWNHAEVTVSPDGQEIYWTSRTAILYSKLQNGSWTSPQIVSFSGQGTDPYYDDVPVVSPDNTKLFFLSKRPIGYATQSREHIWYVERTSTGWSEPIPLPQNVNSIQDIHWQVSVANNGTLYYGGFGGIFYSTFVNGAYADPEPLRAINNFGNVTCPFISPDEAYIIFCNIVAGRGSLYVSFKDAAGEWGQPQILNNIPEVTSFVTRDGRYLFALYNWISADIIEDLRPGS
ncbi:MAG: hypothetical protein KKA84_01920 [Bacteroidetes bacterium]|nr:hypothetical protein [Bacteroidota bacterium]